MIDRQRLLNQSYQQINWALSNRSKYKINRKIRYKTRRLQDQFGLEKKEIVHDLYDYFLSNKIYEKISSEKPLSTFISHLANYGLNIQLRQQCQEKRNYPCISLDSLVEDSPDGYCGSAISFLETLGADGLVEYTTPEDLMIAKELMELIIDHFGENDSMVLLGYSDRQTESDRLSIKYDTYCKRLSRKIKSFLPKLQDAGYLD